MRVPSAICVAALFGFLFLGDASGQSCFNWMTPEYNIYTAASTDGTNIYTSVLVDGTTGGTCNPNSCDHCNQILNPPPVHTPKAYNLLGSTGGWGTGTAHAWNQYISEENDQSIAASAGTLYTWNAVAEVLCSAAGVLYETSSTGASGHSPNCGTSGEAVVVAVSSQAPKCDNGMTTYHAPLSVGGSAATAVESVITTTTTDNTLVIDLLGGPYSNPVCSNKSGSALWCYVQDYKAYLYKANPQGNIDWNVQIWCANNLDPDLRGTVAAPVVCQ